jgi:flagellar hook assembly protein FlgD
VALNVYDVKGALVETLLQENMKPGKHHYNWEPQVLSSGVYFMKLTTANKSFTQKVTYIK